MQQLTQQGESIVRDIANRYQLSMESAVNMLVAVNQGGGTMAQFSCPELGSGQWMSGGMTMVSDMFNHGLKATVNNLCGELADALANNQMFPAPKPGGGGGNNWWPGDLGSPSSSGGQNNIRYAYFPSTCRLAVERDGEVSVYDTLNHQIGGVSQQQGGDSSLTFSSQFGTISSTSLPLVSGPGSAPEPQTNFADTPQQPESQPAPRHEPQVAPAPIEPQPKSDSDEIFSLIEKLSELNKNGVLTDQEFEAKKTNLLERL